MMRARRPMIYNGQRYETGQVFDLVETSPEAAAAVQRVLYEGGLAMSAEDDDPPPRPAEPRKRRYKRRDLRAEQ